MITTVRAIAAAALAGLLAASATPGPLAGQEETSPDEEKERNVEVRVLPAPPLPAADGGWLGVRLEDLDADEAGELGLDAPCGARVTDVVDGSPAAEAGLREGDLLLRFDGREVRSVAQLTRLVRETPAGREVALRVRRDGQDRSLSATVGERPGPRVGARTLPGAWEERFEELEGMEGFSEEDRERMRERLERARDRMEGAHDRMEMVAPRVGTIRRMVHAGGPPRLGIEMQRLTDQLAEHFGVDGSGVLVASVREGSAAAEAGLAAGDVIVRFDGQPVDGAGELFVAVHRAEAGPVPVDMVRDGEERSVTVELPERPTAGEPSPPSGPPDAPTPSPDGPAPPGTPSPPSPTGTG